METGAIFDPTGTYRYSLWRRWAVGIPQVTFVMLNPSTADDRTNDATIRRCICFAQAWGYGSLEVVNLFGLVATFPAQLQAAADPIGTENDHYLLTAGRNASTIILAWGNWGKLQQRDRTVLNLLSSHKNLCCLGQNQTGQPRHPLYVKSSAPLLPFVVS